MNKIADLLTSRPVCAAIILAVLATMSTLPQGIPGLHNDDLQIYFMLLNGGVADGSLGYGIYTNYVLGWCIAKLSILFPSVNVYLLYLFILSFVACCCANFFVLNSHAKCEYGEEKFNKYHLIAAVLLLAIVNTLIMRMQQYTHVAIWSAVCGVLLIGSIETQGPWRMRVAWAALLLAGAYSLRSSALVPACFVACVVFWRQWSRKKTLLACSMCGGVIALLCIINAFAYSASPEWQNARNFLSVRVQILDSLDNSGIEKSEKLEKKNIHPHSFSSFKAFVYAPSMYSELKVNDALMIHREGRKGLFGSQILAEKGILSIPWNERSLGEYDTIFRALDPWAPFVAASFIWLLGASRRTVGAAFGMSFVLLCYLGVLFLFHRMVGRVVNPMLYCAAIWMLALPPPKQSFLPTNFRCILSVFIAVLTLLFAKRQWPSFIDHAAESIYCSAHPDTLFLTTQVGKDLYPRGFEGYSYRWMSQSNILPIADGWCFYSPAYEAALRKRGFQSYEAAFMHPNTRIIIRKKDEFMLANLEKLAECEWGKKVELSVEDSFGELYFVKVNQK